MQTDMSVCVCVCCRPAECVGSVAAVSQPQISCVPQHMKRILEEKDEWKLE